MSIATQRLQCALAAAMCLTFTSPALSQTATSEHVAPAALQIPRLDPPRTAADSVAVVRAAAIADTGRMMPGYRDISRYDTPGYCVAAMAGVGRETLRKHERDTLPKGSPRDSLAPAAIAIGKRCGSRFTVQDAAPRELMHLMQLSLMTGDTAKMMAAVNRRVALATTPEARGNVLLDAIEELLNAHPNQPTLAATMVARMDSLGPGARLPRMQAHSWLLQRARQNVDTLMLVREDAAFKAAKETLMPDGTRESAPELKVLDDIYLAWFRHSPTLAADVNGIIQRGVVAMRAEHVPEKLIQLYTQRAAALAASIGTTAPPLALQHVFNLGSDKVKPAPGKVTLLVEVRKGSGIMDARSAMLLRMYHKYAAQGLDIVLVERTQGYSWSSPPQTPADEAASAAWYYLDYLKLPFTLVVQETPFKHLPDGRLVPGRIPFDEQYLTKSVLIGRDQKIFTQWIGFESEAQLDLMLRKAFAEKGSA